MTSGTVQALDYERYSTGSWHRLPSGRMHSSSNLDPLNPSADPSAQEICCWTASLTPSTSSGLLQGSNTIRYDTVRDSTPSSCGGDGATHPHRWRAKKSIMPVGDRSGQRGSSGLICTIQAPAALQMHAPSTSFSCIRKLTAPRLEA
jgi:hypothetical protein